MSMICTCKIQQMKAQGTELNLDRPPDLSEAAGPSTTREEIPIADIPRTTLSGLEAQNPELHRDIVIELQAMRDRRIPTHVRA